MKNNLTHSSRYRRPVEPPGMLLTLRDRRVLAYLDHFRLLTRQHVQALAFRGVSARIAQERLRRLWASGYVDRLYFSSAMDGTYELVKNLGEPVYLLAPKGRSLLDLLGERSGKHERFRPSRETLQHHLVAVDFLVAAQIAVGGGAQCPATFSESMLRRMVTVSPRSLGPFIIPDGAVTMTYPKLGRSFSYPVEVVKASVRSGNKTLRERLMSYVTRSREGWFERVYGFAPIRAVLIMTPTPERARHYQGLAHSLPHGRGLIWTTHYEEALSAGPPSTRFRSESILDLLWVDGSGNSFTLNLPLIPHVPL